MPVRTESNDTSACGLVSGAPGRAWCKSSRCVADADCVEVSPDSPGRLAVRDSTLPDGPILFLSRREYESLKKWAADADLRP
ncbi:DUF397 domain-containing protein [Actinomadura verrucosospora]|uniref:DUF397 domain-containing protein n=1 Tax=Actinomadura verrucosospora TaxID=46165 RepID=UPI00156550C2|nr:DUF397 domain-containing protein [Actinomadura verrucosospora]